MTDFAVTWDYRCPFARNAHEHILDGLAAGADWNVRFVPFSLAQGHVEEGETDMWDRPQDDTGLLALQVSVAVRDLRPEAWMRVHRALFALRHDHGRHLADEMELRKVLAEQMVDADQVFEEIEASRPLATVKAEHEAAAQDHAVWGVPTFIAGGSAAFVRVMDRPAGNSEHARATIDRIVGLLTEAPTLNEFKHTSLDR